MTTQLAELSGRIRVAVSELERIATLACRRCKKSLQDDDYLGSVAFDLQSFYQGLERIFLLVAGNIDGAVPSGENWHRELLDQMARELPGRRPALISESSRDVLQAFRRFRHLARNIYAFDLEPERVRSLADRIQEACTGVSSDLLAFAEFLDQAASAKPEK